MALVFTNVGPLPFQRQFVSVLEDIFNIAAAWCVVKRPADRTGSFGDSGFWRYAVSSSSDILTTITGTL